MGGTLGSESTRSTSVGGCTPSSTQLCPTVRRQHGDLPLEVDASLDGRDRVVVPVHPGCDRVPDEQHRRPARDACVGAAPPAVAQTVASSIVRTDSPHPRAIRRLADSNCCKRLCRPLPNHSAKAPRGPHRIDGCGYLPARGPSGRRPFLPDKLTISAAARGGAALRGLPALRGTRRRPCSAKGSLSAEVMLVGEQPGDQEDQAGAPFVGPAGKLLDRALAEAGDRPAEDLRHERGQALQVEGAGHAAHPRQADLDGAAGLPPVARGGARARQAAGARAAGRNRGADPARQELPVTQNRGEAARLRPRGARRRDDPPERGAALATNRESDVRRARRRPPRRGFRRLYERYTFAACLCRNGAPRSACQDARERYVARGVSTPPLVVERAEGARVWDADGREYIDFAGGSAREPRPQPARASSTRCTRRPTATCTSASWSACTSRTSRCAVGSRSSRRAAAPSRSHVLLNSGAEAIENAVKIARVATGRPAVIVFDNAFHGRTLLTMSMTSKVVPYKKGFGPFAPEVYRAPAPYPFRGISDDDAIAALSTCSRRDVDPESVACAVLEPVQGEGGFIPMTKPTSQAPAGAARRARDPLRRRRGAVAAAGAPARCGRSSTSTSSPT